MATANKAPPNFSKAKSYSDWIRFVRLWTKFTDLDPTRQGPAIVMTLEGKALDTILELDDSEISGKEGVNKIINSLSNLYKIVKLNEKFKDLEKFEPRKRHQTLPCNSFCLILTMCTTNYEGMAPPYQATSSVLNSSKLRTFQPIMNNL